MFCLLCGPSLTLYCDSVFSSLQDPDGVMRVLEQMRIERVQMDAQTVRLLLRPFVLLGDAKGAMKALDRVRMLKNNVTPGMWISLIRDLGQAGEPKAATQVFLKMDALGLGMTTKVFNSLCSVYGRVGDYRAIMLLIQDMKKSDAKPDHETYASLVYACGNAAKVELAWEAMKLYARDFPQPHAGPYTAMVSVLVKSGQLKSAEGLLGTMARVQLPVSKAALLLANGLAETGDFESVCKLTIDDLEVMSGEHGLAAASMAVKAYARAAEDHNAKNMHTFTTGADHVYKTSLEANIKPDGKFFSWLMATRSNASGCLELLRDLKNRGMTPSQHLITRMTYRGRDDPVAIKGALDQLEAEGLFVSENARSRVERYIQRNQRQHGEC